MEMVEATCKRDLAQNGIMGSYGLKLWMEKGSLCFCEPSDKHLGFTMEEMFLTSCVILPTFEEVVQCGLV
jgi:hypothetical protein